LRSRHGVSIGTRHADRDGSGEPLLLISSYRWQVDPVTAMTPAQIDPNVARWRCGDRLDSAVAALAL